MNKSGSSLAGWTEIAIFSILFISIFSVAIISQLNTKYNKNFDNSFGGLTTIGNNTLTNAVSYQNTLSEKIKGDVSFDSNSGLTLKSSWEMITSGVTMIWNFITGGWIEGIVGLTTAPAVVGIFLRLLWFVSLGYIILRILFKVNA